ncbi:MAG: hypothetical protein VCA38_11635 [Roseibacillus sp.]
MEIDIRRGGLLGTFWLLTGVCAFFVGRGADKAVSANSSGVTSVASVGAAGRSDAELSADQGTGGRRGASRRVSTVGRFISFTRRLSDEELSRLLPEITEKIDLAEVREALERLKKVRPGPGRRVAKFELIDRMAQLDAMATFMHIAAMEDAELRDPLKKRAVKGWASVDPAKAHAWVQAAQDLPADTLRAVWEGIAKSKDLAKTLEFIAELGPGSNGYSMPYEIWDIYMTLHELYRMDDRAVTAWVEELPPGETRDRAFHSVVDQLARHDPLVAKAWIEEQADASNISVAQVELAESWARHDPEAAVEWVATLPANTEGLRQIYERLFTRFIQYDFLDAANYLVQQEPSPALDTAFEVYIDKVKTIDPESTIDWAVSITDEARRWAAIQEVATVWRGRDAAALNEYVSGMDLSEAQRNTLLGR